MKKKIIFQARIALRNTDCHKRFGEVLEPNKVKWVVKFVQKWNLTLLYKKARESKGIYGSKKTRILTYSTHWSSQDHVNMVKCYNAKTRY